MTKRFTARKCYLNSSYIFSLENSKQVVYFDEDDGPENIIVAYGENDDRENVVEL